ncbi:MAG: YicC/YloC family endoribonuclease [bacterium]
MVRSMTGFGATEFVVRGKRVRVEINSVNNRFLETSIRLPKKYSDLENQVREVIGGLVARGKLFVAVSPVDNSVAPDDLMLNEEVAATYYKIFTDLKKRFKLAGEISVDHFAGLTDLFNVAVTSTVSPTEVKKLLAAIRTAVINLNQMRAAEGRALATDMRARAKAIERSLGLVEKMQPQMLDRYRERLRKRVREILGDEELPKPLTRDAKLRFDMEVALMADKSDITEECVRLRSHCRAFSAALKAGKDAGKKLNFILQEMNREANTIGSKASLYDISAEVIRMKEEVEKLREQVQNIE